MDRKTLWLSLLAGSSLFIYGIKELYQKGDWIVFILGLLIIAFSLSGILRNKSK